MTSVASNGASVINFRDRKAAKDQLLSEQVERQRLQSLLLEEVPELWESLTGQHEADPLRAADLLESVFQQNLEEVESEALTARRPKILPAEAVDLERHELAQELLSVSTKLIGLFDLEGVDAGDWHAVLKAAKARLDSYKAEIVRLLSTASSEGVRVDFKNPTLAELLKALEAVLKK